MRLNKDILYTYICALLFLSFYISGEAKGKREEKHIKLEKNRVKFSKVQFLSSHSILQGRRPSLRWEGKAVNWLWLRPCSSHCNCLNNLMIGAQIQGSHSITYETRWDCGTPSSGKKKTVSGSKFTETLQQIGYISI